MLQQVTPKADLGKKQTNGNSVRITVVKLG